MKEKTRIYWRTADGRYGSDPVDTDKALSVAADIARRLFPRGAYFVPFQETDSAETRLQYDVSPGSGYLFLFWKTKGDSMRNTELRITIEVLDSDTVRPALDSTTINADWDEPGLLGDIESAIDKLKTKEQSR